jgi:hypothetical protein
VVAGFASVITLFVSQVPASEILLILRIGGGYGAFRETVVGAGASVITLAVSQVPASEILFIFLKPEG